MRNHWSRRRTAGDGMSFEDTMKHIDETLASGEGHDLHDYPGVDDWDDDWDDEDGFRTEEGTPEYDHIRQGDPAVYDPTQDTYEGELARRVRRMDLYHDDMGGLTEDERSLDHPRWDDDMMHGFEPDEFDDYDFSDFGYAQKPHTAGRTAAPSADVGGATSGDPASAAAQGVGMETPTISMGAGSDVSMSIPGAIGKMMWNGSTMTGQESAGFNPGPKKAAALSIAAAEFVDAQGGLDDRRELAFRAARHVDGLTGTWPRAAADRARREFVGAVLREAVSYPGDPHRPPMAFDFSAPRGGNDRYRARLGDQVSAVNTYLPGRVIAEHPEGYQVLIKWDHREEPEWHGQGGGTFTNDDFRKDRRGETWRDLIKGPMTARRTASTLPDFPDELMF